MQSVKGRGVQTELRPLIRRVRRAFAMARISKEDHDYINNRLEEVEARIITMTELGRDGEELLEQ
jgi:hypothetical protein